jgi:nucleoside-diphosphate-sugar epimerase
MSTSVIVAGAAGVIGRQLVPLLVDAGCRVFGTTRKLGRVGDLGAAGAEPVLLDVFDAPALETAFARIRPEILIHQLTDLPEDLNPAAMPEALVRNARVRSEGTANLMRAAQKAGVKRAIAQSIAWLYAPGPQPHQEEDRLGVADGASRVTLDGVLALERAVLLAAPVEGIVLRYGQFYGPGTINADARGACPVHVEAAAHAALLAIGKGRPGVYNVADDNTLVSTAKVRQHLGWDPAFRRRPRTGP